MQVCSFPFELFIVMCVSKYGSIGRLNIFGKNTEKKYTTKKRSRTAMLSVKGAQKMIEHTKSLSKKIRYRQESPSTGTLSTKFKPVASENYEFKDQRNFNTKWTLLQFQTNKISIKSTQTKIVPSKKYLKLYDCQFRPWKKNSNP